MSPYCPSVWGGVVLGFIELYWLPMASSMCCSGIHSCPQHGSKELCSLTELDLCLGNSAEGKQPPRSGWCLVWTQDRWCRHSGTGSVRDRALIHLLYCSGSSGRLRVLLWWQRVVGRRFCGADEEISSDKGHLLRFFLGRREKHKSRAW